MTEYESQNTTEQTAGSGNSSVLLATAVLITASMLPFTNYLPSMVAYGVVCIAYAVFILVTLPTNRSTVVVPTWALITLGVTWSLYIGHLYLDVLSGEPNVQALIRVPAFVVLTGVNVIYLPRVVSREKFFRLLPRLSAPLVVVGLPTLFVDSYPLGIVDVVSYRGAPLPFAAGGRNVVSSIFANPNTMSFVTMVGSLTACGEFLEHRNRVTATLVGVNFLGLYLAYSRASLLAATGGLCVFAAFLLLDARTFRRVYVVCGLGGVLAILMIFEYVPGPSFLANINVSGRNLIWAGGVRAVLSRPLFGFGAGLTGQFTAPFTVDKYAGFTPHNSYLRIFIETGIVGGLAYVVFVVKTLLGQLDCREVKTVTTLVVCTAISVSMIFKGYTLFGISVMSLLSATIFGYGLQLANALPDAEDVTSDSESAVTHRSETPSD